MNPYAIDCAGLHEQQILQYYGLGERIRFAAQTRWLDPEEIREILVYGVRYGFSLLNSQACPPSSLPQSGSIFLVPPKLASQFRKDGGCWKRRGGSNGGEAGGRVREDHVRLRQANRPTVAGQYVHGEGIHATLKRREYSFYQMKESLHLFHYLDTSFLADKVEGEVRHLKELLTYPAIFCQQAPAPLTIDFPSFHKPAPRCPKVGHSRSGSRSPPSVDDSAASTSRDSAPAPCSYQAGWLVANTAPACSIEKHKNSQPPAAPNQMPQNTPTDQGGAEDFMIGENWCEENMDLDFETMLDFMSKEEASPIDLGLSKNSNEFLSSVNQGSLQENFQPQLSNVPNPPVPHFAPDFKPFSNNSFSPAPIFSKTLQSSEVLKSDVQVKHEASISESDKMCQLEQRIAELEAQNRVLKESPAQKPQYQVIDFSPTSASTSGGTKVLVVLDRPLEQANKETGPFFCLFGPISVPSQLISPTVLKVITPARTPSTVQLQIMDSSGSILASPSSPFTFEDPVPTAQLKVEEPLINPCNKPRMPPAAAPITTRERSSELWGGANAGLQAGAMGLQPEAAAPPLLPATVTPSTTVRKRREMEPHPSPGHLTGSADSCGSTGMSPIPALPSVARTSRWQPDRESKIRIIEKINTFESAVRRDSRSESPSARMRLCSEEDGLLDDVALNAKPNEELEELLYKLVIRVVGQLVEFAATDAGLEEELNQSDAAGYSLLHYCCLYDLGPLVPVLLARGAAVNQVTSGSCKSTPLHLAAHTGNLPLVQSLVDRGGDPCLEDAQGCTPADRAFSQCHWEVGNWLAGKECSTSNRERTYTNSPAHSGHADEGNSQGTPVATDTLLQNALSSLSLHDKCALSLSLSNMKNESEKSFSLDDTEHDVDSGSVISEKDQESLDVAISMMGPEERVRCEEEACIIQHNIRAWVIRRNYKSLREAAKTLQTHWRERQKHKAREQDSADHGRSHEGGHYPGAHSESEISAANTLQAATRRMLANRRQLAQIKQHTLASLVIQKHLKHWLRRNSFKKMK